MNLIPDIILRAVCWTLLHSLWQGLILAVIAGLVMVLSKRAGAALRYNLLCSLMIVFIAVSGFTFYRQLHTPVTTGSSLTGSTSAHDAGAVVTEGKTPLTTSPDKGNGNLLQTNITSFVQYFNAHASLVVVTWFIIFLARFVKVLSGLVYVQRIRHYQTSPAPLDWQQRLTELLAKLRIKVPVSLLESALVKIPVVVGFLKPVILVPVGMLARLSPQQVESILIHELAHILRRDYLFNLVQHLVDTLFFFNPALLWVSSLIRGERENCCDDIAIGETKSRRQFVEALVSFHEYAQSVQGYALSFAEKENHVVRRVKRIIYRKNHSLNSGERVLLMSGLLVLSAAFITINGGQRSTFSSRPSVAASIPPVAASIPPVAASIPPVGASSHTPPNGAPSAVVPLRGKIAFAASRLRSTLTQALTAPVQYPGKDTVIKGTKDKSDNEEDNDNAEWQLSHKRQWRDLREQLATLGFHNISDDKLDRCIEHGVRADFIAAFQKMGYTDISLDRAIELVDHGVRPEFINEFKAMGYKAITLDRAQELVDHGVTTGFIIGLRELGFPNVSLDKATELIDHGVTLEFIEAFKKKTGSRLELDDYIRLRDSGISPS
jgi:beta-lactamase regulating signal transducer with metallopeptidase domain